MRKGCDLRTSSGHEELTRRLFLGNPNTRTLCGKNRRKPRNDSPSVRFADCGKNDFCSKPKYQEVNSPDKPIYCFLRITIPMMPGSETEHIQNTSKGGRSSPQANTCPAIKRNRSRSFMMARRGLDGVAVRRQRFSYLRNSSPEVRPAREFGYFRRLRYEITNPTTKPYSKMPKTNP